jgi:hypothetical protein
VTALLRYQAAIMLRSHRWLFPLLAYIALIAAGVAGGGTPLSGGLSWSAAMLVPVVAFGTRSVLTAEPEASRACVAAAAGPVRAQACALLTALGGGVVLAIVGACIDVVTCVPVRQPSSGAVLGTFATDVSHPAVLLAGLATAIICLLTGSAIGALLNPPLVRHTGLAILATLTVVILALVSDVSPAGVALRRSGTAAGAQWPGLVPFLAACLLLAVTWAASAFAAARRDSRLPSTG